MLVGGRLATQYLDHPFIRNCTVGGCNMLHKAFLYNSKYVSPPPLYNSGGLCYVSIFACVMCSFMLVDCADCSTLLAPLVAGASRPQGSLREPHWGP